MIVLVDVAVVYVVCCRSLMYTSVMSRFELFSHVMFMNIAWKGKEGRMELLISIQEQVIIKMPMIAGDCPRLPGIARDCQRLPEIVGDCQILPEIF